MIQIELDKPRNLKYGIGAVRDLENALGGKPLGDLVREFTRLGINALIIALLHGLKHEDSSLSVNLMVKILDTYLSEGKSLSPLYDAVSDALNETGVFRTAEEAAEGKSKTPIPA